MQDTCCFRLPGLARTLERRAQRGKGGSEARERERTERVAMRVASRVSFATGVSPLFVFVSMRLVRTRFGRRADDLCPPEPLDLLGEALLLAGFESSEANRRRERVLAARWRRVVERRGRCRQERRLRGEAGKDRGLVAVPAGAGVCSCSVSLGSPNGESRACRTGGKPRRWRTGPPSAPRAPCA